MKKLFSLLFIGSTFIPPVYANQLDQDNHFLSNTCLMEIDKHIKISDQWPSGLVLNLPGCGLEDKDMLEVIAVLDQYPEIKWLNAPDNNIGNEGARLSLATTQSKD